MLNLVENIGDTAGWYPNVQFYTKCAGLILSCAVLTVRLCICNLRHEKCKKNCHHTGSFKLKMHQNPFPAGLRSGPRWSSLIASLNPIVGWEGDTPPPLRLICTGISSALDERLSVRVHIVRHNDDIPIGLADGHLKTLD